MSAKSFLKSVCFFDAIVDRSFRLGVGWGLWVYFQFVVNCPFCVISFVDCLKFIDYPFICFWILNVQQRSFRKEMHRVVEPTVAMP
jgi:hypothetical protein